MKHSEWPYFPGGAWVLWSYGAYRYKIVYTEHCTRPKVYIKVS